MAGILQIECVPVLRDMCAKDLKLLMDKVATEDTRKSTKMNTGLDVPNADASPCLVRMVSAVSMARQAFSGSLMGRARHAPIRGEGMDEESTENSGSAIEPM